MRLGTTIEWPIFYQITQEEAIYVEEFKSTFKITMAVGLIIMIPFCTLGTLLPTWMFINTMQLLAHVPLLNAQLPSTVQSLLLELLSLTRLDWLFQIFGTREESELFKSASENLCIFDQIRYACGYTNRYVLVF